MIETPLEWCKNDEGTHADTLYISYSNQKRERERDRERQRERERERERGERLYLLLKDKAREQGSCLLHGEVVECSTENEFGEQKFISCTDLTSHSPLHFNHIRCIGIAKPERGREGRQRERERERKEGGKNRGRDRKREGEGY